MIQFFASGGQSIGVPALASVLPMNLSRAPAAALVAQTVKNPPAMQETQVQSLGWEDLWEEEMATHPSILAWKIHRQRSLAGYSPRGRKEPDTTAQHSNTQRLTP